jgi:hypothetical protein
MKTNYSTKVLSILTCSIFLFGCSKEDALYSDNFGNVITQDSPNHPITGKRSFQCTKYFSKGNVWESYEFETAISPTHKAGIFIIGPINLDNKGTSGQQIENNSNFTLDNSGNLRGNDLISNYENVYSLIGIYDSTTNKIKLTLTNLTVGGYCGCDEK